MKEKQTTIPVVPPGYKRTEVGVIPEDWDCISLEEIATVKGGKRLPKGFSLMETPTPYPYIRVSDMFLGGVSLEDIRYVPEDAFPSISNYRIFKDDIFISVAGTLGIVGIIPEELDGANLTENADRITDIQCDQRYLLYWLMSEKVQKEISSIRTIGAQPKLALGRISKFRIALPQKLSEQKAIARALADTDAWIEALERLIAKKRAAKQAAMADLLTGRVRLPGFTQKPGFKRTEIGLVPEDWEVVNFGQLVTVRNVKVNPSTIAPNTPVIELENIGQGTGKLLGYSVASQTTSMKYTFQEGDVLFGRLRAYLEKYWLAKFSGVCTTEIWPLIPVNDRLDNVFLFFLVQTRRFIETASIAYGTHMPRTDWENLKDFQVPLPTRNEQQAIARVLSDMDAEIEALERERDKARAIKQGMMQELLTGRIRLVKPQEASQSVRPTVFSKPKRRNEEFLEAVLLSVVTKYFSDYQHPIGRFRRTKLVYLLRRHLEVGLEGYLKKAAGPYRPKTKYAGAEKIALTKGYVKQHQVGRITGFIPGDHIHEAESYFLKWYGREPIQWLDQFRYRKNEELELLTTVDMAIVELQNSGKPVNVATIKAFIHEEPEWLPKLNREIFSDFNIARAMRELRRLF